jgi:BRCT domain type II-containing protein
VPTCAALPAATSIYRGGEFHKSLKKTTSWLVKGDKPGASKLAAAKKWGTKVLTEEQFFEEMEKLTWQKQGYT